MNVMFNTVYDYYFNSDHIMCTAHSMHGCTDIYLFLSQ